MDRRWWVGAVLCVAVTGVSGCGGGDDDAGPSTAVTRATSSAPATPASTTAATSPTTSPTAPAGDPKARIDDLVAEVQKQLQPLMASLKGTYSSIRVLPDYPHGLEYVYVYAKPVDKTAATTSLDGQVATLQSVFDTQVAPEMRRRGIKEPEATWTYQEPDGSEIWSHTIGPK